MDSTTTHQDSTTNGGLGNFAKFPPEIRTDIFRCLLPDNFSQVYHIHKSTFILRRAGSSPHPTCFRLSKQLRSEILGASNVDREHKIIVRLRGLETNFIANQPIGSDTTARTLLAAHGITACNMLNITIMLPTPRSAKGFAQLRSNVHDLVEMLNEAPEPDILPKLTVRLEYSQEVDRGFCAYNDFSLLMGPFYRLRKPCRAVMMYRTTGSMTFTPAIEEQCNLLEESLKGGAVVRSTLKYQQCNLEIKLSMLVNSYRDVATPNEVAVEVEWLKHKSTQRVYGACIDLMAWYAEKKSGSMQIQLPRWLSEIHQLAGEGRLSSTSNELRDEICGGERRHFLTFWVSGHNKAFNPVWAEIPGESGVPVLQGSSES